MKKKLHFCNLTSLSQVNDYFSERKRKLPLLKRRLEEDVEFGFCTLEEANEKISAEVTLVNSFYANELDITFGKVYKETRGQQPLSVWVDEVDENVVSKFLSGLKSN